MSEDAPESEEEINRRHAEKAVRRHVKQLEALGFHVTIEKAA